MLIEVADTYGKENDPPGHADVAGREDVDSDGEGGLSSAQAVLVYSNNRGKYHKKVHCSSKLLSQKFHSVLCQRCHI